MHEFTPEAVSRLATKFGAHLESFGEELAHTIKAATTNVDPDAGLGVFDKIVCVMRLRRFLQCNMMQPR